MHAFGGHQVLDFGGSGWRFTVGCLEVFGLKVWGLEVQEFGFRVWGLGLGRA